MIMLLSLSAVSAADDDILSVSDADSADIVSASFSNLQTLIDSDTTGEITLNDNYIHSSSDSYVTINKTITINGNSKTMDANGCSQIFNITGSKVVLKNLTITNINITDSKTNAIYWGGENGQLINCTLSNNCVSQFLGAIVYWNASEGLIDDCTFINNDLSSNNSPVSYPVLWFGDNGQITNSTFINNTGTVNGGAVYWGGGADNGLVYNCTFINNTTWYGGAVYWNGANGTVSKSYFSSNVAKSSSGNYFTGGAIYWYSQDDEGRVTGCVFVDNYAASGEAIAIGNNTFLTLENSVFINNNISNANTVNATTDTASAIANSNWWGNTVDNLDTAPNTYGNITVDNWLFLNTTAYPTEIYAGKSANITFDLTHIVDSEGTISEIDSYDLHSSNLEITDVTGGSVNGTVFSFENGTTTIQYDADEEGDGSVSANVLGLDFTFDFTISTSNVQILVDDIYIGQDALICIDLPYDATGNVSVNVNGSNYTVELTSGKGNVSVADLSIGSYTVYAYYEGNDLNPESENTTSFNVLPKEAIVITVENTTVVNGTDFTFDITASDPANITVTVILNNESSEVEIINGSGTYEGSALDIGNYSITVNFDGNYRYNSTNASAVLTVVDSSSVILINAPDLEKYYRGSERFVVNVTDGAENPLAGKNVQIIINGMAYTRETDENGTASMAINLAPGEYNVVVSVNDTSVNATICVKTTVNGSDITKIYKNGTQYWATFLNTDGSYLANGTSVQFNINGVIYTRYVSTDTGLARLNINLAQGNYTITAINPVNNEYSSNIIVVLPSMTNSSDLVKYYRNSSQYYVTVLDGEGNSVGAGVSVTFNINGVFYTRQTNSSGIAGLNINLQPGTYIITAEYNGCKISNNITVLSILSANDLTMSYRDGSTFDVRLVDGEGNPAGNERITFNINGVMYYRTTTSSGIASLNINLLQGNYIITSSYNGTNIANTITIS